MADNVPLPASTGKAAADEVTYSGDTDAQVQLMRPIHVTGSEGSRTVVEITSSGGLLVDLGTNNDVSLNAGSNAIGKLAANSGVDIGDVDVTSLPALPAGDNNIGNVDVVTLPALAAGTNNIGDVDVLSLPALPAGTNNIGDVDVLTLPALAAGTNVIGQTYGSFVTCSTDITRPANTTQYTANDAWADATPTAGGFTFSNAGRVSGGSGIITDAIICTDADAGTLLQGEIMIFDQAVTAVSDNAAFAITDAEAKTLIGKIPFTLEDIGNNGWYHAQNLSIGYTCVGTANLRFLVRVKNPYTPASGETLTCIIKCMRID